MIHRGKILGLGLCLLLVFLLIVTLPPDAKARATAETCPQFVQAVMERVHANCANIARNEACYAHNRVDALFWQPRADLIFSAPADHAPLIDLRAIATTPLDIASALWGVAVLRLQADVPESLPGQVVTFVLMGDVALENAVSPEQVAAPVQPVQTITLLPANLRSLPTTTANILGSIPAGTSLALIGADETRNWYEAAVESVGRAWISGDLLARDPAGSIDHLPVTYGAAVVPRYGPMQAFYLRTGLATPTCAEAPDALVVQNTSGMEVTLDANGVRISLGSTVILTTITDPTVSGGSTLLVGVLIEGHVDAATPTGRLSLTQPGQAFAVTLNAAGRADAASQFVDLSAVSLEAQVRAAAVNACHNARRMDILARALAPAECMALANVSLPTTNPAPPVSAPVVSDASPAVGDIPGSGGAQQVVPAGGDPGQSGQSGGSNNSGNTNNGNGGGNALGHTQDYGQGNNDREFSNNRGGNGNGNGG